MRWLLVHSAPLVLLIAGPALAGQYQRTRDGRTLVWNEDHKSGEVVSWSGKRDADRYATGHGTLTWYTPRDVVELGSNLPRRHYTVSSRVSGTMVHGKFEEIPAPVKPKKKGRSATSPQPSTTPSRSPETTPQNPTPAPTNPAATPTPTVTPTPSAASDSLDSLMHVPSSLKVGSPAVSPSPAIPSASGTPDVSLQLAPPTSPSPSPQ